MSDLYHHVGHQPDLLVSGEISITLFGLAEGISADEDSYYTRQEENPLEQVKVSKDFRILGERE